MALETLLPAAMRLYHAGALTLPQLFRAMALNPANRLGLPQGRLALQSPGRSRAVRPRRALPA